ncbi:MAG: polymerase sigma factor, sigma-70 family [Planctomycetaceae bacterium]|nr:polymerase sigma factor, sigma-70 family [Planctomycetaceae bacterium]
MSSDCASLNDPAGNWLPETSKLWLQVENSLQLWGNLLLAQEATAGEAERRKLVLAADIEDIEKTLQGQGDAYARLVARYQGEIGQWLWRFSRDRTVWEELVQSVFVEAYLHLARFRREAPFLHWLRKIATRVGYHHWQVQARQRRRNVQSLEIDPPMKMPETEASEQQDEVAMLHVLLNRLPPRDRLVLTLLHIEERSVAETAQLVGWSQVMVKVQAFRARKKLRDLWQRREA